MTHDVKNVSIAANLQNWRKFAQLGVGLVAITSPFVFVPPREVGSDSSKVFAAFTAFILAVVVALLVRPLSKFNQQKSIYLWTAVSITALVVGGSAFFIYFQLRSELSVEYAGSRVVIGAQFTREGKIYKDEEPAFTNEQAVMDAAGNPAKIWTSESIRSNAIKLSVAYFFVVLCLALAMITGVQGSYYSAGERIKKSSIKNRRKLKETSTRENHNQRKKGKSQTLDRDQR